MRRPYLVLTHAVTRVEDDPLAHHLVLIFRVVVEAVVGLAAVLQLRGIKKGVGSAALLGCCLDICSVKHVGVGLNVCSHHSKHAGFILRDGELRVNVIQEPLEVFTAQPLSELPSLRHVSKGLLGTKTTQRHFSRPLFFHIFSLSVGLMLD